MKSGNHVEKPFGVCVCFGQTRMQIINERVSNKIDGHPINMILLRELETQNIQIGVDHPFGWPRLGQPCALLYSSLPLLVSSVQSCPSSHYLLVSINKHCACVKSIHTQAQKQAEHRKSRSLTVWIFKSNQAQVLYGKSCGRSYVWASQQANDLDCVI